MTVYYFKGSGYQNGDIHVPPETWRIVAVASQKPIILTGVMAQWVCTLTTHWQIQATG